MSRIPGSFLSDDDDDDVDLSALADLEADEMMTEPSDEDDADFVPGADEDSDGGEMESTSEDGNDDDAEDAADPGPNLQIAYDARTRQILIVDARGNPSRLEPRHLVGSNVTMAGLRRMLEARFGRGEAASAGDDDEEEEDDEETYWGPSRRKPKAWYSAVVEPVEAGVRLERSGDFGPPPRKYASVQRKFKDYSPNLATIVADRKLEAGRSPKTAFADAAIPNSAGTEVSQFTSKVYSGQYSADGSFFYSACQDFRVYIYDTRSPPQTGSKSVTDTAPLSARRLGMDWEHRSSLKTIKVVKAHVRNCRWTITDANLSKDNQWLIYSSITPRIHLVKTGQGSEWETEDHDQQILDFAEGIPGLRGDNFGIWSIRFSNDGREIIAGANADHTRHGQIFVYDLETNRTVLRVRAHAGDVNAVAFADSASSNLLLSGSDDSFVKVWDRRSLSGERASGTLVGHTEGITFVAPKGDGRYCISNGKDQAVKLWDLRMMMGDGQFQDLGLARVDYGIPDWDYRESFYRKPAYLVHPNDVSVMTYRGHSVLRTLIRCHFSPAATTDQRYIYSGSADGKIHIWSLDGRITQVLDRRLTLGLINQTTGAYNDPSAPPPPASTSTRAQRNVASAVRDVSWHPLEPTMISTAWEGQGGCEGSLAMHEWRPRVRGEGIEDGIERAREEARG